MTASVRLFLSSRAILSRVIEVLNAEGWSGLCKKVLRQMFCWLKNLLLKRFARYRLCEILKRYPSRTVVVFPPIVPWNLHLFQRPHHVAKELAALGYLYFFCVPSSKHDDVAFFAEVAPGCYITPFFDVVKGLPGKIIHLYSTDNIHPLDWVRDRLALGDRLLYEYIDEIHEDISGKRIPPQVMERHRYLLRNEDVICVATADKLFKEVQGERSHDCALITNGVDIAHFSDKRSKQHLSAELGEVIAKGRPVIGYFGALAKWFDYGLVANLAKRRPNYEIVLIGPDYDGSAQVIRAKCLPNVTMLGSVDYKILPDYASWFDVAIIPFVLNDITASTSPIKLFEYMALGLPIVTTDMPECRKYAPVLIGKDVESFIEKIDVALLLRNNLEYKKSLRVCAEKNSWESKASEINALLRCSPPG